MSRTGMKRLLHTCSGLCRSKLVQVFTGGTQKCMQLAISRARGPGTFVPPLPELLSVSKKQSSPQLSSSDLAIHPSWRSAREVWTVSTMLSTPSRNDPAVIILFVLLLLVPDVPFLSTLFLSLCCVCSDVVVVLLVLGLSRVFRERLTLSWRHCIFYLMTQPLLASITKQHGTP